MSPNEQKITSGRDAISSALSMTSSGVTQTGQPGPWIISIVSGSSWSMPCRMIEWVWPPHTSMIDQRWLVAALIWSMSLRASSGSLNSSRYFMTTPRNFHWSWPALGVRHAGLFGGQLEPVAELLLEHAEMLELGQRPHCRLLVKPLERETHMDDHVLADLGVGYVLQADILFDAAEVDDGHHRPVAVLDADDLSPVPPDTWAPPFLDGIPHQQLTQCDAAVVGRHQPMRDHLEIRLAQRLQDQPQQQRVLEHTAGQRDGVAVRA